MPKYQHKEGADVSNGNILSVNKSWGALKIKDRNENATVGLSDLQLFEFV